MLNPQDNNTISSQDQLHKCPESAQQRSGLRISSDHTSQAVVLDAAQMNEPLNMMPNSTNTVRNTSSVDQNDIMPSIEIDSQWQQAAKAFQASLPQHIKEIFENSKLSEESKLLYYKLMWLEEFHPTEIPNQHILTDLSKLQNPEKQILVEIAAQSNHWRILSSFLPPADTQENGANKKEGFFDWQQSKPEVRANILRYGVLQRVVRDPNPLSLSLLKQLLTLSQSSAYIAKCEDILPSDGSPLIIDAARSGSKEKIQAILEQMESRCVQIREIFNNTLCKLDGKPLRVPTKDRTTKVMEMPFLYAFDPNQKEVIMDEGGSNLTDDEKSRSLKAIRRFAFLLVLYHGTAQELEAFLSKDQKIAECLLPDKDHAELSFLNCKNNTSNSLSKMGDNSNLPIMLARLAHTILTEDLESYARERKDDMRLGIYYAARFGGFDQIDAMLKVAPDLANEKMYNDPCARLLAIAVRHGHVTQSNHDKLQSLLQVSDIQSIKLAFQNALLYKQNEAILILLDYMHKQPDFPQNLTNIMNDKKFAKEVLNGLSEFQPNIELSLQTEINQTANHVINDIEQQEKTQRDQQDQRQRSQEIGKNRTRLINATRNGSLQTVTDLLDKSTPNLIGDDCVDFLNHLLVQAAKPTTLSSQHQIINAILNYAHENKITLSPESKNDALYWAVRSHNTEAAASLIKAEAPIHLTTILIAFLTLKFDIGILLFQARYPSGQKNEPNTQTLNDLSPDPANATTTNPATVSENMVKSPSPHLTPDHEKAKSNDVATAAHTTNLPHVNAQSLLTSSSDQQKDQTNKLS